MDRLDPSGPDWKAASELIEHGVPGGFDPPGRYYWTDGCTAVLHRDGVLDVTRDKRHVPFALPGRHELLAEDED